MLRCERNLGDGEEEIACQVYIEDRGVGFNRGRRPDGGLKPLSRPDALLA